MLADINYELSDVIMQELSGKEGTSELMAVVRMRDDSAEQIKLGQNPLLAVFDYPSNKGNLGTLIRSCDLLGVDGLVLTGHAVDLYDLYVIISSMGSFFHVSVIRMSETADELATIPMAETCCASSFNVSCASTVLFYEAVGQRAQSISKQNDG